MENSSLSKDLQQRSRSLSELYREHAAIQGQLSKAQRHSLQLCGRQSEDEADTYLLEQVRGGQLGGRHQQVGRPSRSSAGLQRAPLPEELWWNGIDDDGREVIGHAAVQLAGSVCGQARGGGCSQDPPVAEQRSPGACHAHRLCSLC